MQVEIWNGLPEVWIIRLGNKHNDDAAAHLVRDFKQCVYAIRNQWEARGKVWNKDTRTMALEVLGIRNPGPAEFSSNNTYLQIASAGDALWEVYHSLLEGTYTPHIPPVYLLLPPVCLASQR